MARCPDSPPHEVLLLHASRRRELSRAAADAAAEFVNTRPARFGRGAIATFTTAAAHGCADLPIAQDGLGRISNDESHFDEPNVLAHVRFNDRTIDGKKTLFIEEVQSDWHQAGKREGYQAPRSSRRIEASIAMPRRVSFIARTSHARASANRMSARRPQTPRTTRHEIERGTRDAMARVPDAPFKTTWPELSLKRMIRYAAENGYDKIAWTPGEVQAERYDLSKQVEPNRWASERVARMTSRLSEGCFGKSSRDNVRGAARRLDRQRGHGQDRRRHREVSRSMRRA
jgi:hypothetical protein